jgi:hypothetical protein
MYDAAFRRAVLFGGMCWVFSEKIVCRVRAESERAEADSVFSATPCDTFYIINEV